MNYPRAVTHVGINVTDIEAAIRWYREIFGFQVLTGPVQLVADDSHFGIICRDIFGSEFRKGRLALLTGSNGVCVEVKFLNVSNRYLREEKVSSTGKQ